MANPDAELPPLDPAARKARRVLKRSRVAKAAANAVLCLFLATLWLIPASELVADVARLARGEEFAVASAANRVLHGAWIAFGFVFPLAVLLLVVRFVEFAAKAEKAQRRLRHARTRRRRTVPAAVLEELRDNVAMLAFLAFAALFVFLFLVGNLLKAYAGAKVSHQEKVGSVISDLGAVGTELLYCFIVIPILAPQVWMTWKMA